MADRKQLQQPFITNLTEEQVLLNTIEEMSNIIQEAKRRDELRSMHCPDTPYFRDVKFLAITIE